MIPHPANSFDLGSIKLVSINELRDAQSVTVLFQAKYPVRYNVDAWMNRERNTFLVTPFL